MLADKGYSLSNIGETRVVRTFPNKLKIVLLPLVIFKDMRGREAKKEC